MRLLIKNDDHYSYLNDCVALRPNKVMITSYGVFAGILADGRDMSEWGKRFHTRDLLEAMADIETVQILVGVYEYKSCKSKQDCLDCEQKYVFDLIRHLNHADKFPHFQWRVTTRSHAKCVLFTYPDDTLRGVAGGRNFTNSDWADVSVELDKMSALRLEQHVTEMWQAAKPLTGPSLSEIMVDQGISAKTIENIMAGTPEP